MLITVPVPENSKLLLKDNQKVDIGTPFYERRTESKVEVQIAKKLNIEPSKIFHYLNKLVGEKLSKGDTIALKKGFLTTSRVKSEYDGIIQEVDHNDGIVVITIQGDEKKIHNSFFKGKIKKIEDNEIKLEVEAKDEYRLNECSLDFGGAVFYSKNSDHDVNSSLLEDKIVVGETVSSYLQIKSEALGATGFVTLSKIASHSKEINYAQLKNIADVEKIFKHNFPYCILDKKNSRITFYK